MVNKMVGRLIVPGGLFVIWLIIYLASTATIAGKKEDDLRSAAWGMPWVWTIAGMGLVIIYQFVSKHVGPKVNGVGAGVDHVKAL